MSDEITLSELIRNHQRLQSEHDELYKYAHDNGHEIISVKVLVHHMNRAIEHHEKQLDQLRKFMWVTIGAIGVVNVLIPLLHYVTGK